MQASLRLRCRDVVNLDPDLGFPRKDGLGASNWQVILVKNSCVYPG